VKLCGYASVLICEYIAFELTYNCVSRVSVKMAAYEFPIDLGTVLIVGVVYCVFQFIVLSIISSTPHLGGIRTHNFSGDMH
jgi:hypothetical protein